MVKLLLKIFAGLLMLALLAFIWLVYAMREIGPGYADFAAQLPHEYVLHRTSAHQIIIWGSDETTIPTKVVELDHDAVWLIAKQQHLQRRSPNNPGDTYEYPAEGQFSYWILNMATDERYGPLTEADFTAQRQSLGVPASLSLHNVYDYRP